MSDIGGAVEALTKSFNTAEMSEARMMRKILREIRPHVSEIELSVLLFVWDRTYAYGKTSEVIPMKHFLEGVSLGSGEMLHPPLRAGRRTIYRAIENLIANVIIIAGKTHRTATPTYAINPVWMPPLCHQRHKLVSPAALACASRGTYNYKNNNIRDTQQVARVRASASEDDMNPRDALLASVAAATAKNRNARDKNKAKLNATGLEKIWEDAFIAVHPEETYFRWRRFEQAAFKKAVERGVPATDLEALITFCVTSFDNVINEHFSWMKSKPAEPAVGFVTKHIAEFYQSYKDSIDPNRKLRGRIKRTEKPSETNGQRVRGEIDQATSDEVRRLRAENEALKAKVGESASARRKTIKRLVHSRKPKDDEFGSWD